MKRFIFSFFVLFLGALVFPCFLLTAKENPVTDLSKGQSDKIYFFSSNPSYKNLVSGLIPRDKVTVNGILQIHKNAKGKIPATIIVHTSSGVRFHEYAVAESLTKNGIAAFILNSHVVSRGNPISVSKSRELIPARIADAYAALVLLGTHPRIDRNKIAIIGFSSGGAVAVLTASKKIRESLVKRNDQFAAHIGVYPYCWRQLKNATATSAPILMLLGELDNQTPASQCVAFSKRIRSSGGEVKVVIYKGAYHAFDFSLLAGSIIKGRMANFSKCEDRYLLLRDDGNWFAPSLNKTARNVADFGDITAKCKFGNASYGGPYEARTKSINDYLAFLKGVFKLP